LQVYVSSVSDVCCIHMFHVASLNVVRRVNGVRWVTDARIGAGCVSGGNKQGLAARARDRGGQWTGLGCSKAPLLLYPSCRRMMLAPRNEHPGASKSAKQTRTWWNWSSNTRLDGIGPTVSKPSARRVGILLNLNGYIHSRNSRFY
jgi:hypothetical protein